MRLGIGRIAGLAVGCAIGCALLNAQTDSNSEWIRVRGIFLSTANSSTQALKFLVLDTSGKTLSVDHVFHSGEHIKFQFELKRDAYVYVFNSDAPPNPADRSGSTPASPPSQTEPSTRGVDATRGVDKVPFETPKSNAPRPPRPLIDGGPGPKVKTVAALAVKGGVRQLLPLPGGIPRMIRKGVTTTSEEFELDSTEGIETLVVIVSPHLMDTSQILSPAPQVASAKDDTEASAIANLGKTAESLAENATVAVAGEDAAPQPKDQNNNQRGIYPVSDSYAVARNSNEAFAVQVLLKHKN